MDHAPRGSVVPRFERSNRPRRVLVGMANVARIGNFQDVGVGRRDELERMAADVHIRNRLLDLRHVAGNTLTPCAAGLVMRMGFDARRVRAVLRIWAMTT